MDPAAAIAKYLATPKRNTAERLTLAADIRRWFYAGGFHPMLEEVRDLLTPMVSEMPAGWADDARSLGAR